jgi:hypothetical protein
LAIKLKRGSLSNKNSSLCQLQQRQGQSSDVWAAAAPFAWEKKGPKHKEIDNLICLICYLLKRTRTTAKYKEILLCLVWSSSSSQEV